MRDNRKVIRSDPLFVNLAVLQLGLAVFRRSLCHIFSQGYCFNSILIFSYLWRFGDLVFWVFILKYINGVAVYGGWACGPVVWGLLCILLVWVSLHKHR